MEIAEYENGSLARRYIPGHSVDQRVAKIENDGSDTTHFYHANRLGSVQAVVNASGVVTDKYIYTPFGVQEIFAADSDINRPSGNPFRYTGRRYDVESGLYYYRARYYDSELGRFLETDPVGYVDHMNMYVYVANDPLSYTDPSGMQTSCSDYAEQGGTGSCVEYERVTGKTYDLLETAVKDSASAINDLSQKHNSEWGIVIADTEDGKYEISVAVTDGKEGTVPSLDNLLDQTFAMQDRTPRADNHSHGTGTTELPNFVNESDVDRAWDIALNRHPNGLFLSFTTTPSGYVHGTEATNNPLVEPRVATDMYLVQKSTNWYVDYKPQNPDAYKGNAHDNRYKRFLGIK